MRIYESKYRISVYLTPEEYITVICRSLRGGHSKYLAYLYKDYYERTEDIALTLRMRKFERRHNVLLFDNQLTGLGLRRWKFK